jgi:hypothetical protein
MWHHAVEIGELIVSDQIEMSRRSAYDGVRVGGWLVRAILTSRENAIGERSLEAHTSKPTRLVLVIACQKYARD